MITTRKGRARRAFNETSRPLSIKSLVTDILMLAEHEFPGYRWCAGASEDGGSIIQITLDEPGVDISKGCWTWHTNDIQDVSGRRDKVRHACGQVLERYHLARHRRTEMDESTAARNMYGDIMIERG